MFIPHTDSDREAMLREVGVERLEDLFQAIPAKQRFPTLELPEALTEMEALAELTEISAANETVRDLVSFLGAGAYNHYSPPVVDSMLRRGEFFTAYTPYQPELSQGTLQAIFEFQSLITALTGMDVSNASHYDGASATAEAVTVALAHYRGKRNKIIVSPGLHPHYRQTIRTYHNSNEVQIVGDDGEIDLNNGYQDLLPLLDTQTALVIVQYPDFFGRVQDYLALAEAVHAVGALLCVSVNPIALGLLTPPGEFGADIVTGEGQSLGIPLSFGGPYLGIFAASDELVRKIAGRLIGESVDNRGQRAYVLTLTAREQHIRRDKATSNICSNQGLVALAATIYMSLLGKQGMRQVAELCYHKAHYAAAEIAGLPGFKLASKDAFFNEFAVICPKPVEEINEHLLDHGILGGYALGSDYPGMENILLVAVTEMNSKEDIDMLVEALAEVSND